MAMVQVDEWKGKVATVEEMPPPPEKRVPWWLVGLVVAGTVGATAYMLKKEKERTI